MSSPVSENSVDKGAAYIHTYSNCRSGISHNRLLSWGFYMFFISWMQEVFSSTESKAQADFRQRTFRRTGGMSWRPKRPAATTMNAQPSRGNAQPSRGHSPTLTSIVAIEGAFPIFSKQPEPVALPELTYAVSARMG